MKILLLFKKVKKIENLKTTLLTVANHSKSQAHILRQI
jgi:hypothetical protein